MTLTASAPTPGQSGTKTHGLQGWEPLPIPEASPMRSSAGERAALLNFREQPER